MDLRSLCIINIMKNNTSTKGNVLIEKIIDEVENMELSDDIQINLIRINIYGKGNYFLNLKKIIKKFKDNYDIVLAIVKLNPKYIIYASDRLKYNYNLALIVVGKK